VHLAVARENPRHATPSSPTSWSKYQVPSTKYRLFIRLAR
jgi:hypothetical protein